MHTVRHVGQAGLQGWREKVADAIAQPVAARTGFTEDQIRALVGAAFFVLALTYVAKTVRALAQQAR